MTKTEPFLISAELARWVAVINNNFEYMQYLI